MRALILLLLLAATSAQAAEADHPAQLLRLLRGVDDVPSASELSRATTDPQAALFRVAVDPTLGLYPRRRAASLLQAFPDETSEAYLVLLATVSVHPRLRWIAIYTVLRGWGQRAPERLAEYGRGVLGSPIATDREAAARGLGWVAGDRSRRILEAHESKETAPLVLKALRRSLARHSR